jgi:hypothetical protein
VVVSSKGKKTEKAKIKQNHTKQPKKPHKVSQVQMQYSFSKFFSMQVQFGCYLIKSREREKKKESGDSSVNGYPRLWLACPLLSACCCWRLFFEF